jgi:hypothetical protein
MPIPCKIETAALDVLGRYAENDFDRGKGKVTRGGTGIRLQRGRYKAVAGEHYGE